MTICNFTVANTSKTEQFIKECITARLFNHPNVLGLIGVSYIKGEAVPLMILPFMHNGDIKSFMKAKRGNVLEVTEYPEVIIILISSANVCAYIRIYYSYIAIYLLLKLCTKGYILLSMHAQGLDYKVLTKMCIDIAKGMKYLSSLRYVHCDLAARNCM